MQHKHVSMEFINANQVFACHNNHAVCLQNKLAYLHYFILREADVLNEFQIK